MFSLKKIFFAVLILFFGTELFAGDYFVCLASYKKKANAESLVLSLEENQVKSFIAVCKNDEDELFRVLYDRPFDTAKEARSFRNELSGDPVMQKLSLKGLWILEYEKPAETEPVATVSEVTVEPGDDKNLSININVKVSLDKKTEEEPVKAEEVPVEIEEPPVEEEPEPEPEVEEPVEEEPEPEPELEPEPEPEPEPEVQVQENMIYIKDADTGLPVQDAEVSFIEGTVLKSDASGAVVLPELSDGIYSIKVSCEGYVDTDSEIEITESKVTSAPMISIPPKVEYERVKIVLDWGDVPLDLDAHVICGDRHVSFKNRNEENMTLDQDGKKNFGTETITLQNLKEEEVYSYYVFNFTSKLKSLKKTALSNSKARVSIYANNELVKTFAIKSNTPGKRWHVFDIVEAGKIVDVNTLDKKEF